MPVAPLEVTLLEHTPNADALIYAAARQCYSDRFASETFEEASRLSIDYGGISEEDQLRLIRQVIDSGHDSPIEHVSFTFAISGVSRALSHQLVRHRIASYSQQSQRYVEATDFRYIVPPEIAKIPGAAERYMQAMKSAAGAYADLMVFLTNAGRGKKAAEDARYVLPNACETRLVVTMNCRSLLHFFSLRCCERAQWEIRELARLMLAACMEVSPCVFALAGPFCKANGRCKERDSCGRYPRA